MSGLLLCGKTSDRPFYVKEADINLYSMEELCYFVYNNIYLLGNDFFDDRLISFIDRDLELNDVAERLKLQALRQESFAEMIKTILDGCYYYSEEEKQQLMEKTASLERMTKEERIKSRADIIAASGRLNSAAKLYRGLLKTKNDRLAACVWNNLGVIYAKQFLFLDALKCFEKAFDIEHDNEYKVNLICAAVLQNDGKCIDYVKEKYGLTDEIIDRYRQAIGMQEKEIRQDKNVLETMKSLTYSADTELAAFYKGCGSIIDTWKKEYREQIR